MIGIFHSHSLTVVQGGPHVATCGPKFKWNNLRFNLTTNFDFQKQTSSFKNKLRIPKSNSFFLKTKSVFPIIKFRFSWSNIDRLPLLRFLYKRLLARAFSKYFRTKRLLNKRKNWLTIVRKPSGLEIFHPKVVVSFHLKACLNRFMPKTSRGGEW